MRKDLKTKRQRQKAILVFAENDNDSYALKHLVEALRPGLAKIEIRKRPMILARCAQKKKRDDMCAEMGRLVGAENIIHEVISVIAHRDCDAVEPAHLTDRDELVKDMAAHKLPFPVAATPAFEIESWWFLWPSALAKTRPCWSPLTQNGHVGKIQHAKEKLRRDLRPSSQSNKCPDYSESDSRRIAENVKHLGIVRINLKYSDSFADFVRQIDEIGAR